MKNLKIEDLTLEQKIGMVMCGRIGYASEDDIDYLLEMIRNRSLGCIQAPYNKPELMKRIKETADYPILVIVDMEMGYPASKLPPIPQMTLAACDKPEYYQSFARAVVTEAKEAGCNGTWGPNLDLVDKKTPRAPTRRLSDEPELVGKASAIIAQVYANNNFLSCGKHYPGGVHLHDSHMANTGSPNTLDELMNEKLVPYKYLMEKGLLPSIMVGHSVYPNIDPDYPASLSKKVIGIIRDMGFDGLCFTDSFGMMAILQKYGEDKILGMAIAAGNDIVLPNYRTPNKTNFENLMQNYRDGMFSEDRLNEAVRRVLAAQARVGQEPEHPDLFTEEDRVNYYNIAKDCITAITDPGVNAALPADNKDRLFVILAGEDSARGNLVQEVVTRHWYHPEDIEQKIHEEFPEAEVVTLPEFPNAKENERVLVAATRHKEVVFITHCNARPYQGSDCLTRRVESVINALILSGKVSAVLHFGNPFAMKNIDHVPRRLFGYVMPQSQLHAIEVLAGKLPAKGKLPYTIDFQ